MNRSLSKVPRLLRWRYLRWVASAAVLPALWACNSRRLAIPDPQPAIVDTRQFKQTVNHKLDIMFMVDNSQSMRPLQAKMKDQLPAFMDALVDETTKQLPDLHVGVVSSSYGGGAWSNVNQCHSHVTEPNTLGDDNGRFLQGAVGMNPSPCNMLHSGAKYLANLDGGQPNYDGDIRTAFQCIALLGDTGCGFESQFESVYYALDKANHSDDPDNGGFLRADAVLAIVMVTNEDDCSVRGDSLLLAPSVNSATDPIGLGALQSYRCNEFGHLCDGQPPPHGYNFMTKQFDLPMQGVTLNNCVSAEENGKTDDAITDPNGGSDPTKGHLWPTVADFSDYIKQYKRNPDDILVAAIAGPVADSKGNSLYKVIPQMNQAAMNEMDPVVDHSCVQQVAGGADPEFGDPAVRIKQWVDSFGANGIFYPICANDFKTAMTTIAMRIHAKLGASCVSTNIAPDPMDATKHNCRVNQKTTDSNGTVRSEEIPECDAPTNPGNAPCYQLVQNSAQCTDPTAKTLFRVCNDASCMMMQGSTDTKDASISCAVE